MRAWMVLWWVAAATAPLAAAAAEECNVTIESKTYKQETLVDSVGLVSGLAVDFSTGLLYFSYNKDQWVSATLNLITGAVDVIPELKGRCTFTVDQVLQEVHAGCYGVFNISHTEGAGLYQFDSNRDRFVFAGEPHLQIQFVYYKDVLYYVDYIRNLVFTFSRGHSTLVTGLSKEVLDMVVDGRSDRIFYNNTGVYRQRARCDVNCIVRYSELAWVRGLAVDGRGSAHACGWGTAAAALYRLLDEATGPTAAALLPLQCFALTFDQDNNIIYATNNRIVRLVRC